MLPSLPQRRTKLSRRIRRERRRLGRFVAFSENALRSHAGSSCSINLQHRRTDRIEIQQLIEPVMRIEPEQYRRVGACLAVVRRRAKLTQTEAADRLGRKQTFVCEIERGLRRVDVIEIVLISRALDADPVELFAEIHQVTGSVVAGSKTHSPKRRPKAR